MPQLPLKTGFYAQILGGFVDATFDTIARASRS
jgi:hypothetical protein